MVRVNSEAEDPPPTGMRSGTNRNQNSFSLDDSVLGLCSFLKPWVYFIPDNFFLILEETGEVVWILVNLSSV